MSRSPTPEMQEIPISAVVWAKMKGFPAWPAKVIDPKANDLNPKIRKEAQKSPPHSHFVRFYGTHDFSWVLSSDILWPFEKHANLESAAKKKGRKPLLKAIAEAKLCLDEDSVEGPSVAVNHNNNNKINSSNNNNNNTPEKQRRNVSKWEAYSGDENHGDFSDNGLVIDTSTSSSFSTDVKAEVESEGSSSSSFSNAISRAANNTVDAAAVKNGNSSVAAVATKNDAAPAAAAIKTESSIAPAKFKGSSPGISVRVGQSSRPINDLVSPIRSSSYSATLSFDLKSVMNGLHSPPKQSNSSPGLHQTPPPSRSTTTKRKSPLKESSTEFKRFKKEDVAEEEVPIEDEDASILPEEEAPEVGGEAVFNATTTPTDVKSEAMTQDDATSKEKNAKTLSSMVAKKSKPNGEPADGIREVKPNIGESNDVVTTPGRARLSNAGGVVGAGGDAGADCHGVDVGATAGGVEANNPSVKKSSKNPKGSESASHSCSVKVRKLSSTNLKTETPSSPKKDPPPLPPHAPHPTPPPHVPVPTPQSSGQGKSAKSSPSKKRKSSTKCISPLKRPHSNHSTSASYHEHFQDWIIEDFSNVTKLFSKPGTYIQGRKFLVQDDVWVLRLYPCGDTGEKGNPNFVGIFVELVSRLPKDVNKDVKAVLKVSILNKDKSKVWGEEMAAYTAHNLSFSTIKERKRNVMGYAQFISRDTLFKHKDLFLPDGNLTLGVKLVVLGEMTTRETTTARPFTNATAIATDYAGIIDDPIFSDFSINVEGKTVRAHKAILAARSAYFRDMFLQRQEDIHSFDSIHLDDVSYRILHDVILFVYSGHSSILRDKPFDLAVGSDAAAAEATADALDDDQLRLDSLRQLVAAAEKYQIAELKSKAEREVARMALLVDS